MKWKKSFRYLNERIKALAILEAVLYAVTALFYLLCMPKGAPLWPLLCMGVSLVICLLLFYTHVVKPQRKMERKIELFLEGYTIDLGEEMEGVSLTPANEKLLYRMREEFRSSYLLKLSKRQAQYRALQNQINPHFLYNTLESIRSEALIAGLESVADMTEALAVFFRYTISKVENLVSVEEELHNCETYFHIQQYRFGERLSLQIECDAEDREELLRCRLPKLTLQPILENSIIHGTEYKIGVGHLVIRLARMQKSLLIVVSDDGIGMDEAALARLNERLGRSGLAFQGTEKSQSGGIALVNVNNRIRLLFGEEYGMSVHSMPGLGTDVEIFLPLITTEREVMDYEGIG